MRELKYSKNILMIMFLLLMIAILALWQVNIEADRYAEAVEFQKKYISNLELEKLQFKTETDKLEADKKDVEIGQAIKYMKVEATAYCPCSICCGKYADGYTATGIKAVEGRTCAVDPNVIPLGSRIWIPSLNLTLVAEDTGAVIKGNIIDIYMDKHQEALNFGRQELEIYVLERVDK